MIVRTLDEAKGTEREVSTETWISRRLLLADDRMGFSLHDTTIRAGAEIPMCYRNHLEAVYCVAGRGSIEVKETGLRFEITDGTVYALDRHDEHILRAETEMRMVCVFNPPLVGPEVHDGDGAYPLLGESGDAT
jgi:L-ectoine synthase